MQALVEEIVTQGLDREALRERRRDAALGQDGAKKSEESTPPAPRPWRVRFNDPERIFSVSLSFRTDQEPETEQIISALQELIQQLKDEQKKKE